MDYGWLWWSRHWPVGDARWQAWSMNGSGGNTVQVFPGQRLVVVITTSNYNERQPHVITARLMTVLLDAL